MKRTLAIAAVASLAMASDMNDFHDNNLDIIKDIQRAWNNPKIAKDTVEKLFGFDDLEIENELHVLKELEEEVKKVGKNPGLLTKTFEKLLGYDDFEFDNEFNVVGDAKRVVNNPDIIKKTVGKLFGYDDEFNVVEDAKRVKNNPNIITNTIGKLFGYDDLEFDDEFNVIGETKKVVKNPGLVKEVLKKLVGQDDIEFDDQFNVVVDAKRVKNNPNIITNTIGKLFGYDDIENELSLYGDLKKIENNSDIRKKIAEIERAKHLRFEDLTFEDELLFEISKHRKRITFDDEDNELAVLRDLIHEAKQIKQENTREKKHFRGIHHHEHQEDLEIDNDLYKIPPVKVKKF